MTDTVDNFDVSGFLDDHLGGFEPKHLLMIMQMEWTFEVVNPTLASARLIEWQPLNSAERLSDSCLPVLTPPIHRSLLALHQKSGSLPYICTCLKELP